MEAILLTLAAGLGPAILKVIEKLGEKALVEPALKSGLEPFQEWLTSGYDRAKAEENLHQALLKALDDLRAELDADPYERLFATMKFTGLPPSVWQTLAAAAVEMVRPKPADIPDELLDALGLAQDKKDLLARFLCFFRKRLANVDGFKIGIQYANDLQTHGLLAGITREMNLVAAHTGRTAAGIEALVRYFGIATDEDEVLREYLETLREQLEFLPLPLADPGAASQVDAELRQVFVPLTMRDLKAERETQRRMERQELRRTGPELAAAEEETRSIGLGDILARRTALSHLFALAQLRRFSGGEPGLQ